MTESTTTAFEAFFAEAEPRLRRALTAAYGPDRGREAAAEALAYAWQHWDRVAEMANPVGYLYRVGISRTRARKPIEPERLAALGPPPTQVGDEVDPELWEAVTDLSDNQRVAVVLVHAFGWAMRDVADLLGVSVPTVGTHLRRGLATLRRRLADNPAPGATEAGTSTSTTTSTTVEDPDA